eukprot:COSAG06_NODE_47770_length_337_cov_0.592437_1_plen_63_part_00
MTPQAVQPAVTARPTSAAATARVCYSNRASLAMADSGDVPRKVLGRTGLRVSVLGTGGAYSK